jgi:hypothetical protein
MTRVTSVAFRGSGGRLAQSFVADDERIIARAEGQ